MGNKYLKKLYYKQWVIGIMTGDIREIIRQKKFSQDIKWIKPWSSGHFQADPFIVDENREKTEILFEEFSLDRNYGNISYMVLDKDQKVCEKKILLDTGSHLSFPFVYKEKDRVYVVPESARSGKVSCYEFIREKKELIHLGDMVKMPLYDPSVLKMNGRYWLMGSEFKNRSVYHLHVFHAESLLGPYVPLPGNPVRSGLDGVRAAGSFIKVDGSLYRPAQNCSNKYGESITINKISALNENEFSEEPYMIIEIDERNTKENSIKTIHTLNVSGNRIVVDGMRWELSLTKQINNFFRNRRILKSMVEK